MESIKETPAKKPGLKRVLIHTILAVAAVLLIAATTTGISMARGEQVAYVASAGANHPAGGNATEATAVLHLGNGDRVQVTTPAKTAPLTGTKTVVRQVNDNKWAIAPGYPALSRPFETAPLALGLTTAIVGVLTLAVSAYRSQKPSDT